MSKRLPYFQFEPAEYITKNIQFCSMSAQGVFINICAIYWQRDCDLTIEQLERRFGNYKDELDELFKEEILTKVQQKINIDFLVEQYSAATGVSVKRSEAGKKSAELKKIRRQMLDMLEFISKSENVQIDELKELYQLNSTNVEILLQQKSTIKIRLDKIKEDKKNNNIPAFEEFKQYAISKKDDVDLNALNLKYESWKENGWKNGNGKKIKNWKSTLLNTLPYIKEKSSAKKDNFSISSIEV